MRDGRECSVAGQRMYVGEWPEMGWSPCRVLYRPPPRVSMLGATQGRGERAISLGEAREWWESQPQWVVRESGDMGVRK